MSLRIGVFTRYGIQGASSRVRFFQYIPLLESADIECNISSLFDDLMLSEKYSDGSYSFVQIIKAYLRRIRSLCFKRHYDLIWIEKEALPWWPLWAELALLHGLPYVLDYDDAVFHNYDMHRFAFVRRVYGRRLDGLMAKSALVVGGNEYLAKRAREAGAPWVEVLPTVIDLRRYPYSFRAVYSALPKIVWIGSPSTVNYLRLLQAPLQALAKRIPFVFRVIGCEFVLPGVQVECVPWAESTEVESIAGCAVGVMPLLDSPWECGKCGYKLIQYMACGLPVVASPVGVNSNIVREGVNGFLADGAAAWIIRLEQLLTDSHLRAEMGAAGRLRVEQDYCVRVTAPSLLGWLRRVAQKGLY